ncbi:hypothetical protein CF319_g4225 [Tilletia indica]|nr:hypothetical protein CF319_g4225 [Tilletia indica]
MAELKDQLDEEEAEKVEKLVKELEEIAAKDASGDVENGGVDADAIRAKIDETQQASLGLFKKVYEKRQAQNESGGNKEGGDSGSSGSSSA